MADGRCRAVTSVVTGPYPEFPTDMQAQIMSVLAYSGGCCDISIMYLRTAITRPENW